VIGRVGFEFDHDGGYRYRITPEGYFEIVGAPADRGVGYELTPTGEFASAWKTLSDYIVAMGPVGGAPSKSPPATTTPAGGSYGPGPRQPTGGAPSTHPAPGQNPTPPSHGPGSGGGGRSGGELGSADFLNQRDNDFDQEGCNHDNQCTPTSATMAILGRMSLDAFYERAMTLLTQKGAGRSMQQIRASQPEDLVIEWIYLNDPTHHDSDVRGSSDNVIAAIEAWTGEDATSEWSGTVREKIDSLALPGVCGTKLTGSGHTVELIDRTGQGIVINDPYGSCRGFDNYLRHGEAGSPPGAPLVPPAGPRRRGHPVRPPGRLGSRELLHLGRGRTVQHRQVGGRLASFGGNLDGVKLLVAKAADVNARASTRFRNTSLQIALLRGEGPVILYLLEHGADPNVRQNQDFVALHEAVLLGRTDLIQLLLDHGAEVNARNAKGETPLGSALRRGKTEAASYLKARGGTE
jgi:hypothetical protein